jgi:phosphoribosylaminoimidazole-succinocarboxamide synthase
LSFASSIPAQSSRALLETRLEGIPLWRRGKVRDVYDLGDRLLVVATDRLSAFDVVLPTGIPDKGKVLTQISLFWFDLLKDVMPNHVLTADVDAYDARLHPFKDQLADRSMIVTKTEPLPVECVVRGYLAGSGFLDYRQTGSVCGIPLPTGLLESDRLAEPIFTPATKAETGHDENIPFERMEATIGAEHARKARELSLEIYRRATAHAESRGIVLADTKLEFGLVDGGLVWIDEALTPDSSRFWPRDTYAPGGPQKSFDKQFVRDWLLAQPWDKRPPGPALPADVVQRTRAKYVEAFERLTGRAIAIAP